MGGGKKSNKIFECFGVRADERSGDKFGVFFRGVSGVELCDQRHTLPPVFFIALPPVLDPLSRGAWSGEEPERQSGGDAQLLLDLGHHRVRQARFAEFREVLSDDALP